MFETLPAHFKNYKIPADVRTLLLFRKAIERNLVHTLGDVFNVLKTILVKEKTHIGPFSRAFYEYFLGIEIKPNETLNDTIRRSEAFKNWKIIQGYKEEDNIEGLVNKFLDSVHLTHYDIKKTIDASELWNNDNPNIEDNHLQEMDASQSFRHDKLMDYSNLSLEEILERMKQVEQHQKNKHVGGSHWIGTGGVSPYGHSGAAKGGLRVGGKGAGKMARAVLSDKNFYPVDINKLLNDDNIDASLATLKGVLEDTAQEIIDIPQTIKGGVARGGLFLPEIKQVVHQKMQIILLIDNGGYSMSPYVKSVQTLFSKMQRRFAQDLETYYFHNTIYGHVYSDAARTMPVKIKQLLNKDPNYRVFIIGDASMGMYEITNQSIDSYIQLKKKYKKIAWLNPESINYWLHTPSTQVIQKLIEMFPLSPKGISESVEYMNKLK